MAKKQPISVRFFFSLFFLSLFLMREGSCFLLARTDIILKGSQEGKTLTRWPPALPGSQRSLLRVFPKVVTFISLWPFPGQATGTAERPGVLREAACVNVLGGHGP